MTLIIGIKCKDGIVLGADGAATYGVLGQPTIRQPTRNKLKIVDQLVVGTSGQVGLGQRIAGEIERLWREQKLSGKGIKPHQAMTAIRETIFPHIQRECQVAAAFMQTVPSAMMNALSHTIAAIPVTLEPCLFQFDYQGSPEMATDDLPFVAVGSGQLIADPFLAFVRRVFWKDEAPTVEQGVFAAVWALQHVIVTSSGGVGWPIQIVEMKKDAKGGITTREIPEPRWQEQLEAIKAFEKGLPDLLLKCLGAKGSDNVKAPPPPPPQS